MIYAEFICRIPYTKLKNIYSNNTATDLEMANDNLQTKFSKVININNNCNLDENEERNSKNQNYKWMSNRQSARH